MNTMQPISRAPTAAPMPMPALAPTVSPASGVADGVSVEGTDVVESSVGVDEAAVSEGSASAVAEDPGSPIIVGV